jgi:serine/threonine-protein kinase
VTPERWAQVTALFHGVLSQTADARRDWLADNTRDDPTLAADVERLLRADDRAAHFLEEPPPVAELLTGGLPAATLTPGQQLGHYEILELVGSGGMGSVYRARDTLLRRTVAIKLLHVPAGSGLPARLLREARAASALNHPHICTVHGLEEADGHAFLVMEFVEGESLQSLSRRGLTFEQVLVYARQIADAVGHAHRQGVVHRDLKTANVLITSGGQVKVLDFGIASQALDDGADDASPVTQANVEALGGTLPYMAPERMRGEAGDQVSDVWSLGIMFWEMSAGELPFTGNTAAEIRSAVLYSPLVSPPLIWSDAFAEVAFTCLSKSPDGRYRDAAALATALKAVPLTAREHTWWRWRPVVIGTAAVAATVAIVLTTYVYVIAPQLERTQRVVPEPVATTPAAPIQQTTLAILPFKPLDPATADAPLQLGLADTLITSVSGLPGVTVRPVSAVTRYAGQPTDPIAAGRDLRVETVLEGTVQKVRTQLRVSVRLFSVADGRSLWGDTFTGDSRAELGVQDAITRRMAQALVPQLDHEAWADSRRRTMSLDAYRAYLQGRYYWNQRSEPGFRTAVTHFERAVTLDPTYAPAYAGIADSQTLLGIWGLGRIADTIERARVAALQATLADDSLPEAHGSLALVRWVYDWNWEQAEREFTRALELNPNYATAHQWYAYFLASRGRFPEALGQIQRARDLDPLSLSIRTDVGEINAWARKPDAAVAELRGVLELDPKFPMAHNILGLTYVLQGRMDEGIAALERARNIDDGPRMMSTLGYAYGLAGNRSRAESLLRELTALSKRRYVSPFAFSLIQTGLGNRDEAFASLDLALHERSDTMAILGVYPWLDPLRSDPRFGELLARTEANRYH